MSNAGFGRSFVGGLVVTVVLVVVAVGTIVVDVVDTWLPVPGAVAFHPETGAWSDAPEPPPASAPDWVELPELPEDGLEPRVFDGGTAIAIPFVSASSVYWYEGQGWRALGPTDRALEDPDAARLADGRIVVASSTGSLLVDPTHDILTPLPAPPPDGWEGRLVAAGDRVYAIVDDEGIHRVAMLVPETSSWTTLPRSPAKRSGAEPQGQPDGSLVLVGGWGDGWRLVPEGLAWMAVFVVSLVVVAVGASRAIRRGVHWAGAMFGVLVGVGLSFLGFFMLLATVGGAHGRPLRLGRRVVRGRVRGATRGRLARSVHDTPGWPTRWLLARAWSRDAALEHASVAAFERLARDLEHVGAPTALIERAREAAAEEAEHARLCLALASHYAGRPLALAPLPEEATTKRCDRKTEITRLALESLVDGIVGEGWAAAAATRALAEATEPSARHALEIIARDEASHAAHACDVLAWCLDAGGGPTRAAVARAVVRERRRVRSRGLPAIRGTEALARHGRFRERRPGALDAQLRASLSLGADEGSPHAQVTANTW